MILCCPLQFASPAVYPALLLSFFDATYDRRYSVRARDQWLPPRPMLCRYRPNPSHFLFSTKCPGPTIVFVSFCLPSLSDWCRLLRSDPQALRKAPSHFGWGVTCEESAKCDGSTNKIVRSGNSSAGSWNWRRMAHRLALQRGGSPSTLSYAAAFLRQNRFAPKHNARSYLSF
jgi:hypothetical protein